MDFKDGKHLTFKLEREEYCIPIGKVKEIIGIMEITEIPKAQEYFKGVINLRGKIIPVVDLKIRFGIPWREYNERTCIVVVEHMQENEKKYIGLIVDSVSEVVNLSGSDVEPPPQWGTGMDSKFLLGIGKAKGRVVLLLDNNKILDFDDINI